METYRRSITYFSLIAILSLTFLINIPHLYAAEKFVSMTADIHTPEELKTLQTMDFPCNTLGECRIQVPEAEVKSLEATGIQTQVIDHIIQVSSPPTMGVTAVAGSVSLANQTDYFIPSPATRFSNCGTNESVISITEAPDLAMITQVDLVANVIHPFPGDLRIEVFSDYGFIDLVDSKAIGGETDEGSDDDTESDDDLFFNRTITEYNDFYANSTWRLIATDCYTLGEGGYIDSFSVTIHYLPFYDPPDFIAPTGTISDFKGNPTYQWENMNAAYAYQIYVAPASNLLNGLVYETNLHADEYCDFVTQVCSVNLLELNRTGWLSKDSYQVWLRAVNIDGHHIIDWAGPFMFTLNATTPDTVTINTSLIDYQNPRPTVYWELTGNAAQAAFFNLYLAPAEDLSAAVVYQWMARDEVCGSWEGTLCEWTLDSTLQTGKAYHLYIQSWGAGGLSTGGPLDIGWAIGSFNVGGPTPALPDANSFEYTVNGDQLTISLPDDANTTSVFFYIAHDEAASTPYFFDEVAKSSMTCASSICSFTPALEFELYPGTYSVYLQPSSAGGPRGDGINNLGWFDVGSFNIP